MHAKRLVLSALSLCLVLGATGCAAKTSDLPDKLISDPLTPYYSVSSGWTMKFSFDTLGNPPPDNTNIIFIPDLLTGDPKYKTEVRMVDSGKDNEYGNPIPKVTSILYDLEGNVVIPETETQYENAMGDLLVRHSDRTGVVDYSDLPNDYTSQLFNVKTGEVIAEGVSQLRPLSDSNEYFIVSDMQGHFMGIIDQSGGKVSGFPAPADYGYATTMDTDEYFALDELKPDGNSGGSILLDLQLNPLARSENFYIERSTVISGYANSRRRDPATNESYNTIIKLPSFEEVASCAPEYSIAYFDGELMTRAHQDNETQEYYQVLCDLGGKELSIRYSDIILAKDYSDDLTKPMKSFIGLKEGIGVDIIDRTGKVTSSVDVPGITRLIYISDDFYSYDVSVGDPEDSRSAQGLLDKDFKIVEPAKYSSIFLLQQWNASGLSKLPIMVYYYDVSGVQRYTLKDLEGNVIIENAASYGTISENYIAVVKGDSYGLIDFKGNWVLKKPIYEDFADM